MAFFDRLSRTYADWHKSCFFLIAVILGSLLYPVCRRHTGLLLFPRQQQSRRFLQRLFLT